jgi:gluconokinase
MVYVVMGVAGSGKTTVGKMLAELLGARFVDGDDYHPETNINKMKQGMPLDDNDRQQWLEILSTIIQQHISNKTSLVLACSALKQKYRDILVGGCSSRTDDVLFVYLKCSINTAKERVSSRQNHYMPSSLIESQYSDLEEPRGDGVAVLDAEADVGAIVKRLT